MKTPVNVSVSATGVMVAVAVGLSAFILWRGSKALGDVIDWVKDIPTRAADYAVQVGKGVGEGFEDDTKPDNGRGNVYSGIYPHEDNIHDTSANVGISA